ncbi:MAG TPA: hypothetical protein VMY05_08575 [Acidobacteriota bacterium]|nr:hypothetical protein [Acidobacteriota bacterium]
MADEVAISPVQCARVQRVRLYRTVVFMGASATVACGSIIIYFNTALSSAAVAEFFTRAELAAVTLMPYMISAVIAALTATAVLTILPATRYVGPSLHLVATLRKLASGNLTTHLRARTEDPLRDVSNELNMAVESLNQQVTQWKLMNRIQWGALCRVRMAAEHGDCDDVLHFVQEMEKNWDRIAEIERVLVT